MASSGPVVGLTRTFQCRVAAHPALDAMGALIGRLERRLYAEIAAGGLDMNEVQRRYIAEHGITARHFRSLRFHVEAVIKRIRGMLKAELVHLEQKVQTLGAKIERLEKIAGAAKSPTKRREYRFNVHNRKRRYRQLSARCEALRCRMAAPEPGVCFGSRRLFRAHLNLAANGYADHAEWLADWQARRSSRIFCVGAKDESGGNQNCTASLAADGMITLRLRLPNCLASRFGDKYITFTGLRFAYGHRQVCAAVKAAKTESAVPITWNLVRDEKGWRACCSITEAHAVRCGDTAKLEGGRQT